ncbi:MAG: hypothetical protein HPY78_08985 [Brevinematales bacterium]|nr:hypothetical protein [Brevinematales bacterium]
MPISETELSMAIWKLEYMGESKFPYRLRIIQGERVLLALRTQDKWPGAKGNAFCLPDESNPFHEGQVIEEVPVVSFQRIGKRLVVVLDRMKNKRCDFVFVTKSFKNKPGTYETIFWRTQQGIKERKPRVKLSVYKKGEFTVWIDKQEKYPWSFGSCSIEKHSLPAGDYALVINNEILALVERKTFQNLLAEFRHLAAFHQALSELERYPHAALVIEAIYADFLNPKKQSFYPPSFCAAALAEIQAFHPKLSVIFAGSRKLANEWTYQFFRLLYGWKNQQVSSLVAEPTTVYLPREITGNCYTQIEGQILTLLPSSFTLKEAHEAFPQISKETLKKKLKELCEKGILSVKKEKNRLLWTKNFSSSPN